MNRLPIFFVTLSAGILAASLIHADSWEAPSPKVFASKYGGYGFKMIPSKESTESQGVLFSLEADGKEKKLWEAKLVNIPHWVLVSDCGKYVVTIDTYANLGYKHVLVVYGEKGKIIADFALKDLLSEDEILKNVDHSVSSRHWADDTKFEFAPTNDQLALTFKWGKKMAISLTTGKIEP